ncbi:MAG TPA: ABC transporter substrate-binding protein [Amycolatopsis sp.]|nr:ABC transporter substrate-binding protein [Amycolatopsis sp.]
MTLPKLWRRLSAAGAAGVLAMGLAACGGGAASGNDANQPLRILYSSGITGLLSPSAKAVERGIKAAVADINAKGGLHGRQVEVTTKDNQSDPTRGVTEVQEALDSGQKPDLVIPGVSSNEALAVAPLLTRNKVVGLGPASTSSLNDPAKYPYFFSQSALQKDILAAVATFLHGKPGVRNVAVVTPDDALGDAIDDQLSGAFDKFGLAHTEYRFPADGVDFAPAFGKALESKPDWIYMDGSGAQVPQLLSGRVKAGGENIPTIAGVVAGSQPLLQLAKGTNQMDNVSMVMLPTQAFVPEDRRSQQFNDFLSGIKAQGPIEVTLSTYGAGWDSVRLWADAVRAVQGPITPEAVRQSLMHLPASDDRLFYKKTYTEQSNFVSAQADEFTIAQATGTQDGMFIVKQ